MCTYVHLNFRHANLFALSHPQAETAIAKAVQAGNSYMADQDAGLCLRNAFDAMVDDVRYGQRNAWDLAADAGLCQSDAFGAIVEGTPVDDSDQSAISIMRGSTPESKENVKQCPKITKVCSKLEAVLDVAEAVLDVEEVLWDNAEDGGVLHMEKNRTVFAHGTGRHGDRVHTKQASKKRERKENCLQSL
eukprot:scaffold9003_cov21-Tisochrysis_lutea.AAC.1